ncbi:MAG: transcriptional regulator, family [Microbacteriaceae bacterium]|jgi:transcriptional regulator with XRE-family HTH domain|nr:transcriptional regulator, family [Microbacteriaceae bacterium]
MSRKKFAELTAEERATYASRVKALRQGRGLTQQALANEAKVSRQTINTLESGASTPQADVLARILRAVGFDVEEPEFEKQTEIWLTMMGTLIEAIPEPRREDSVHSAIRVLSDGLRHTSGATRDVEDLQEVDLRSEYGLAATEDDTGVDPARGES